MNGMWIYLGALVAVLAWYLLRRHRLQQASAGELKLAVEAGLVEPPSLHPVVHAERCIGSGSCIQACPEAALGMVGGKAMLVNPSSCIGHGACHAACPFDAIELVFGSERRGVDIPDVTPNFETNVPGLFIAGELGGMGLIRKAAEQGRQAMEHIRKRVAKAPGGDFEFDVVIVGSGPAGLSAGLAAIEHGLRYRILEQEASLGGSVFHYPRHKVAMTAPVKLALVGTVKFAEVQKEKLLEFWSGVVGKTGLEIHFRECLEDIAAEGSGFVVRSNAGSYRTRSVLLAMGRRGTPRKLQVPGEDSAKVVYRLVDAAQYQGQAVLVVGGGDSALEAAIALAEQPGTTVTLSYRSEAFSRVKQKNRSLLEQAQAAGRVEVLLGSVVEAIEADCVRLRLDQGQRSIANQAVIVCAGGQLPTPLLQKFGIRFETKFGTA